MKGKGDFMNNKKYYVINDKNLACAVRWITGLRFYVFDNENGDKVYSFENTERFYRALTFLNENRNKLK